MVFMLTLATPTVSKVKKGIMQMVEKFHSIATMMIFPGCLGCTGCKYGVYVDIGHTHSE